VTWRITVASFATTVVLAGSVVGAHADTPDFRVASPNDNLSAAAVLQTIRVENENPRGYRRSLFKHWIDIDGDGCDAREQVLRRDAIGFAQVDPFRCAVVEADWVSPYDGRKTSDRSEVDIDHVVALKEAWDSGAWQWSEAQRTAFANDTSDPRTLLAVSSSSNRSKSDRDPSNWLPSLRGYLCTYLSNWISVKARWNLSMDQSEWGRINNLLSGQCVGTTMRGWNPPPTGVSTTTSTASTTTSTTSTTTSTTVARATTTIAPTTTRVVVTTVAPATTVASAVNTVAPASTAATTAPTPTTVAAPTTVATGAQGAVASITPGAFCAPEGATAPHRGLTYVCSRTNTKGEPYSGNRARWRQQT